MPDNAAMTTKTLLLVDGSSYLYRAYHALPDLRSPDGFPTGAIHGMVAMLKRALQDVQPEHAACVAALAPAVFGRAKPKGVET